MSSRQSNAGPETDVAISLISIRTTRPEWNSLRKTYRVSSSRGKFHWDRYHWQLRYTATTLTMTAICAPPQVWDLNHWEEWVRSSRSVANRFWRTCKSTES